MYLLEELRNYIVNGTIPEEKMYELAMTNRSSHPHGLYDTNANPKESAKSAKAYEEYLEVVNYLIDNNIKFTSGGSMKNEDLCIMIQNGDYKAENILIKNNEKFISSIISKSNSSRFNSGNLYIGDFAQQCSIALIKKAKTYDPNKGAKFTTYARFGLREAIFSFIVNYGHNVRVPKNVSDDIREIMNIQQDYFLKNGEYPKCEEIAELSQKFTTERVNELLDTMDSIYSETSIDTKIGDDSDTTIGDMYSDDRIETPERYMQRQAKKDFVVRLFEKLDETESRVLILEYGLFGHNEHSATEIARKLNMTEEKVRRISYKAKRKLEIPEYVEEVGDLME